MNERARGILQVNTEDTGGGAARIAWDLFRVYRSRGRESRLAVGQKHSNDPDVLLIPNSEVPKGSVSSLRRHSRPQVLDRLSGMGRFSIFAHKLAETRRAFDNYRGIEDFDFPGTWQLLDLTGRRPDIVHGHNLHGGYFDLRTLPWLSQQVPTILTLHDAWPLSGHCAHSLNCERWKTGCGSCPDLTLYPAIRRDATAHNWLRKRKIFEKSRLHIATPSHWLMKKVEQSMLMAASLDARVIPNGVDLSIFHSADKAGMRTSLGIPQNAKVLLFAANAVRRNIWKDYQSLQDAIGLVTERLFREDVVFFALGEDAPRERIGRVEVRFIPYQNDPKDLAPYYQTADVYVHAARADTFPNTILEALACGTPVVATAVGGIPEQIEDARTGFLVPAGDTQALADRLCQLLSDFNLKLHMGNEAAEIARRRFDLQQQADVYLQWYDELVQKKMHARN